MTDPTINYQTPPTDPRAAVSMPGLLLMITAIVGVFLRVLVLILSALGMTASAMTNDQNMGMNMFSGAVGIIGGIVTILVSLFIAFGAMKMRNLQGYGIAMTASILAIIPCSACCCITLPFGIWALIVLLKPEVKAAFH